MEPANTIIEICGGFKAVAQMTGRAVSRVHRWTYPKDRGGTGGLVPAEIQQVLLFEAVRQGKPLTPAHFFPDFAAQSEPAAVHHSNQEPSHDNPHANTAPDAA